MDRTGVAGAMRARRQFTTGRAVPCSTLGRLQRAVTEALEALAADGIHLQVRNHGQTIPAEHLCRLFERFYRVDESRERSAQSNGLGLSIVATIMQLHNGEYSVTSADGVTCFVLFFPARQAGE